MWCKNKTVAQATVSSLSGFLFLLLGSLLRGYSLLDAVDELFERRAGLEGRQLRRSNLDRLASLRVAARTSCAIGNLERAEAKERNRVALLQRILDDLMGSRNYGLRLFLGNPSLCGGCFDKICLLQENTLFLLMFGINCLVTCIITHRICFAYRFLQIFFIFFPKTRVFFQKNRFQHRIAADFHSIVVIKNRFLDTYGRL